MLLPANVEIGAYFDHFSFALILTIIALIILAIYSTKSNVPTIAHLKQVPGQLPFLGNLYSLGGRLQENDATIYSQWAANLGTDVFQMRLGDQRTVVANTFASIRDLFVGQANALIDRPHQPGFVDKLGLDISGSPMTESIRRCRMAAMRALGKPQWPGYFHLLEPSSISLVGSLVRKGENGAVPMNIFPYLRQIVFDLTLSLTYGARQVDVEDTFTLSLVTAIREISKVRSSTVRFRDFVPLARIIPEPQSKVIAAEKVRQAHLDVLYSALLKRVAGGENVDCIATSLGADHLTEDEIHGTCKSLLQAAPGTIASAVYQCVAWLCSPEGQRFQPELYQAILDAYGGEKDRAWKMAFREEEVPLVTSLYKETLRFYTVTPFGTPRSTTRDVTYGKAVIPKGTTVIMNAQAGNHDPARYGEDACIFNPRRFLKDHSSLPHLTYGAGSRICPAVAISNRIMSALLIRLILAFQMTETQISKRKPSVDILRFSDVHSSLLCVPKEYDCHFVARDQNWLLQKLDEE
ncbi:cytochrome P450-2 [Coleophoma cylindrospora]|uniref:Cytochrome P450-2 n=1 Tax=Coleophoma cylindrospora TaxID=1849047 RepID=A0A3D8RMK9_9HELO|nr:cytochrome P450-2 [Coleophoma cylindrospora]